MDIDRPPRTGWHDFPDVLIHSDESKVKQNADYPAAKAGDVQAARRLVEATLNEKTVATIAGKLAASNALIASVHAYEAEGINRIPAVLAEVIAERLGLQAEESVVQTNRSGHTGAGGYHRLAHPALFDGEVEQDRNYFLVDDFVGQGGTIANLKGFIEIHGGIAILASTLTGKPYSAKLSLEQATLCALRANMATNWKVGGKKHSGTVSSSSQNPKPDTLNERTKLSSSEIVSLRQDKRATIEKTRSAKR